MSVERVPGLILMPDDGTAEGPDADFAIEVSEASGIAVLRGPKEWLDQIRYVGPENEPIIREGDGS